MKSLFLLPVVSLWIAFQSVEPLASPDARGYKGELRLPVELFTEGGMRVQPGKAALELRFEKGQYSLWFLSDGPRVVIKGRPFREAELHLGTPLSGTILLRAMDDFLASTEDRQHSKTGRAQYEEASHDWKATLRVYRSLDPKSQECYFVFQARTQFGSWDRVVFRMFTR